MSVRSQQFDERSVPQHVAVIMDGNGRWAEARGLPRVSGHKQGVEALRRTVRAAAECGIRYLTFFGFSSENWNRPAAEVRALMDLLRFYLRSDAAEFHENNACLKVIGDRSALDTDIVELIDHLECVTASNDAMTVCVALNYGGRDEILLAARAAAENALSSGRLDDVEADFVASLMTDDLPDPDVLIRTSGEKRISNFLLWQCAYTEFVFTETLWPDFGKAALDDALEEYAQRDRRFGGVSLRDAKEGGG